MPLEISSFTQQQWRVIRPVGSVDSKTVNELRDFLAQTVTSPQPIALDLSQVPFMSSAGLRTLLTLHRQTQASGQALALVGVQPQVADTMSVTGFYRYFNIYSALDELPQPPAETV
jgi:anti-sigma B factor antagonist